MKNKFLTIPLLAVLGLASCAGETAADPKTLDKDDLNPPFDLVSVTTHQGMILQWRITNTEDDFKGYNVYIAEAGIDELQAKLDSSLKTDLRMQQIRRCKGTAQVFSVFGFDPKAKLAEKDCSDFGKADETKAKTTTGLQAAANEEEEKIVSKFVKCQSAAGIDDITTPSTGESNSFLGDDKLSVDIAKAVDYKGTAISSTPKDRVGKIVRCYVKTGNALSNGATSFTNGKKYTAFVVSVSGDKYNRISYTSNFVEDIPIAYTDLKDASLKKDSYLISYLSPSAGNASSWTEPAAGTDCTNSTTMTPSANVSGTATRKCMLSGDLASLGVIANKAGFVVAEDQIGASDRVLIGGQPDGTGASGYPLYLLKRNARSTIYTPGDRPVQYTGNENQYNKGKFLAAYAGDLFDVAVVNGSDTYYGKIFFANIEPTAASCTGDCDKKVRVWAAISTAKNELFYLTRSLADGSFFK
jgi:hypothetical protein